MSFSIKDYDKEAFRLGYIQKNPASLVSKLQEKPIEKGMLNRSEIKQIFDPTAIESIWEGNFQQFTTNLLAISTGMRMGEIQALRIYNYHNDYIQINNSWDRKYGLKQTKNYKSRFIPIPSMVSSYINRIIRVDKLSKPEHHIFHGKDLEKAIDHKVIALR